MGYAYRRAIALQRARKGDLPGHDFHGNQYTDGSGSIVPDTSATDAPGQAAIHAAAVAGSENPSSQSASKAIELAPHVVARAEAEKEPAITAMMSALPKGGQMVGLEYAVKQQPSIINKIDNDSRDKNITPAEAASKIGDSLRFTAQFDPKDYTNAVPVMMKNLAAQGYKVVPGKFKNFWESNPRIYQGINVNLKTPNGLTMELQFHTAQSFYTKEKVTHGDYKEWGRSTDKQVRDPLEKRMAFHQNKVIVPVGAKDIKWN